MCFSVRHALTPMDAQIYMYLRSWIHVCACIYNYMVKSEVSRLVTGEELE